MEKRVLHWLGADGALFLVLLGVLSLVIVRLGGRLEIAGDSLPAPVLTFAPVIALYAVFRRRDGLPSALGGAVRDWTPFVLLHVLYRNLEPALTFLPARSVERTLLAIDERLFGIEPSAWIQRFAGPLLSDYMAFSYALMFVMPLAILSLCAWRGQRGDFRELTLALILCTFAGFLLYIAFPARSPRWACPEIYSTPLHGRFGIYEGLTRAWDHVELMLYDAFPSLHTAVSTISLVYAWKLGPRLHPRRPRVVCFVLLPLVASLQLSTLYLRQHYFIDVVGGWALAAACCALAPGVARAFARLQSAVALA